MVNCVPTHRRAHGERGSLVTEIVIAMFIFTAAVMPLGMSYLHNQMMVRRLYQKAVAMEIIDGEMEVLAAGEWHSFKEGAQAYPVGGKAAKNLPGAATLTVSGKHLRLEWKPENGRRGDVITREAEGK
jgi:hypothetical protein